MQNPNVIMIRLVSLACSLVGFLLLSPNASAETPPNILLIVADDLGFSDLGCYGSEIETPNLDRLAANGVRLTQFYTTGRCCPSRASLLSGYYPHRVGLGHMTKSIGRTGYSGRIAPGVKTIAEHLQPLGYQSYLSGKWHLGTKDPTQHGFSEFYGTLVSAKTFWERDHFLRLPEDRTRRQYREDEFYGTDSLADYALDFLKQAEEKPEQPWFLYLAFNAPHFPLHAPHALIQKYADRYQSGWDHLRAERLQRMKKLGIVPDETDLSPRSPYYDWGAVDGIANPVWNSLPENRRQDLARRMAIYAAMVDSLDQNIGRVIDSLQKKGDLSNTLVIFTSDNGACAEWDPFGFDGKSGPDNELHEGEELEKMGARGTYHSVGSGWANASNTPWRLYKHYNHEGGIAVPCLISWPGKTKPEQLGAINASPTHLIDILPTLISAVGADSSEQKTSLPGQDLLPILSGETLVERPLFFEHEGNRAIRDGKWKLVSLRNQPWELYNMEKDRTELVNLAERRPKVVKQLAKAWNAWAQENHVTPLPEDYEVEYLPVIKK